MIKRKPGLKKISFVSHSVGGLVARYAIGRLYRPPRIENTEDLSANGCVEGLKGCTIAGLEPVNFVTVATPHLGSRGNKQVLALLFKSYQILEGNIAVIEENGFLSSFNMPLSQYR